MLSHREWTEPWFSLRRTETACSDWSKVQLFSADACHFGSDQSEKSKKFGPKQLEATLFEGRWLVRSIIAWLKTIFLFFLESFLRWILPPCKVTSWLYSIKGIFESWWMFLSFWKYNCVGKIISGNWFLHSRNIPTSLKLRLHAFIYKT